MLSKPNVSIHKYGVSLNRGLKLINKFERINKRKFKLEIKLDLSEKDLGYFNYLSDENVIYINPIRCTNNKKNYLLGHPTDCSIYAVICHELAHFLDLKYNLLVEYYRKNFTLKRLILSVMGGKEIIEELADLIAIYLMNPYYLKLMDIERYTWLKGKFKSPRPCGIKTFMNYYNKWSEDIKKDCTFI